MPSDSDFVALLDADLRANEITSWGWRQQVSGTSRNRIMRWQRSLRHIQHRLEHDRTGISLALLWRWHVAEAVRLGFTIPPGVFGPGLQIAHYGTITVNERARVGRDCRIHPSTTIGATHDGVPTIGDRCYIGPGARILGPVHLGNEVVVAANSVVTKSVPDDNVVLAGVPATVIRSSLAFRRLH